MTKGKQIGPNEIQFGLGEFSALLKRFNHLSYLARSLLRANAYAFELYSYNGLVMHPQLITDRK